MTILSLGLGMQSTTLYLMASTGALPRPDHAIFADPGAEHPETYKYLEWLINWQKENNGIPLHIVKKSLYEDLLNKTNSTGQRFASIPAFTNGSMGLMRRQCTKEYKINIINSKIRQLYKLKPRQRMPMTEVWIGISIDEAHRMKESRLPRIKNIYPLINLGMSRGDCIDWLKSKGFPVPVKSSCNFCPYQSDAAWKDLKKNYKGAFSEAVKVDRAIRDSSKRGVINPIFVHRQCKPLDEIEFANQLDLFGEECEGYCHV